ncbi:oxidoreductase [Rhizorhabdus wittichii]|uniref:NADPH--hemoprotein reductase n=1 Tax=Rhizorhabdus wittichii TaxID=160791 RepID=A0A975HH37_9SPHN|nr:oxidoreductase [Rhizorhabdus wittichii]QTH23579.1 oxidoreductase [Rhizorhabdus wittichii]
MNGFNHLLLILAAFAALAFVLLVFLLARRTRGEGLEPPDPQPAPAPRPARPRAPPIADPVETERPPYTAWRLISRAVANPDSAGGPLYRLRLEPEDGLPEWRAGAVAHVYCGPAQDVLDPGGRPAQLAAGDYMIGSLPAEGAIHLVVRKVPTSAPAEGRRSRWLCEEVDTGQRIALLVRDDPAFVPPPDTVPLILIGNATGLAGLHAHIKARPAGTRNWLIFGDRNSTDDEVLAAEIAEWVSTGHLERCDLVFPGETGEQRLVTDQIKDAKAPILDWVLAGGAIYVCGSKRMDDDVHATLGDLLGTGVLEAMTEAGLYRRSVY